MMDKCYVIPVQKTCNADCMFCISKTRNYDKKNEFLEPNEEFINTLHSLVKRGVKKFEITGGGEPFLNPNLQSIISLIRMIVPDSYIKVYTNGNILKALCLVDELDISVVHYDNDINNKYMRSNSSVSIFDKLSFFKENMKGVKIRLSIPLIKGAVDSKEKLETFINKTCAKVDEYVVRTLYPHTPLLSTLYADFEYNHQNVIFEKDNGVDEFDGLILWSDGNIYNNWSLVNKKFLYSYMLLKPDSQTRINDILEYIKLRGFEICRIFKTEEFVEFASKLYQDKNCEYYKKVLNHLKNSAYLFGNVGLVLILDKEASYEQLLKETYLLKKDLRDLFSFTHTKGGYLLIGENISHLNIVHAPDPEYENYQRDLSYIESSSLEQISDEKQKLILTHRSYFV